MSRQFATVACVVGGVLLAAVVHGKAQKSSWLQMSAQVLGRCGISAVGNYIELSCTADITPTVLVSPLGAAADAPAAGQWTAPNEDGMQMLRVYQQGQPTLVTILY